MGETELKDMFARVGSVESAAVMRDMASGRSRGFGFVEMATEEDAQRAIADLNGTAVGGRTLTVNEARSKTDRRPSFGGGGGAGGGGKGHRPQSRW
jgi:RNA recognition motif-containing protein